MLFWPYSRPYSFQSTLPVWGATRPPHRSIYDLCHFNPRSPCGERPPRSSARWTPKRFQSTLPVWGATRLRLHHVCVFEFQSTLPVWGATRRAACRPWRYLYFNPRSPCGERPSISTRTSSTATISIHAPRVGSDCSGLRRRAAWSHFNPRSPCGERLLHRVDGFDDVRISIHAPRVGSDAQEADHAFDYAEISIHAPRVGSDVEFLERAQRLFDFNPRSPCGERQQVTISAATVYSISIHAPRVGSDKGHYNGTQDGTISIHAPRVGSDSPPQTTAL